LIPISFLAQILENGRKVPHLRPTVVALKVTNDGAERGIALITELNSHPLTRDEIEFQRIIQVVEEDRKLRPGVTKLELKI
jgi:hypothetical protein